MSWLHFELPSIGQAIFVIGLFVAFKCVKHKLAVLVKGCMCICRSCDSEKPEIHEKQWKENVVYLYQFPRMPWGPNLSPFCLKVEAFLRLYKIPHEIRYTVSKRSKYGLLPFIELNGEQIADSQFIISLLKNRFNIKENLSTRDQATAHFLVHSFEKNTLYLMSRWKMVNSASEHVRGSFENFKVIPTALLSLLLPLLTWYFKNKYMTRLQVLLGTFSEFEFRDLLQEDLAAIRGLLGENQFIFGDHMSTADISLFVALAGNYYAPLKHHPKEVLKREENKVILDYLERVKTELWPTGFEATN